MKNIKGKIVFITGASSGIGRACAEEFAALGANILLCARRADQLSGLESDIREKYGVKTHSFVLDVRNYAEVNHQLDILPDEWKKIDILVNNAGLARGLSKLQEGDVSDWEEMIDTNVKGLLYISRKIVPWMVARNRGDVINIGSIAGHEVYPNGNVYCATKFAVDALTKGLRMDTMGTGIRVSSIDPGLVNTEFSKVRFHGDTSRAESVYNGITPLTASDIAECAVFIAARPAHVQITDIGIFPTDQRSATNVHREN